jgi:hypothetical protein
VTHDVRNVTKAGRVLLIIPTLLQTVACRIVRLRATQPAAAQTILMMPVHILKRTAKRTVEVRLLDSLRVTVFVDVTSCNLVNMYRRSRGICRFHCQDRIVNLLLHMYHTLRRHNPENSCRRNHHCAFLKHYRIISFVSKPWNMPYRGMESYRTEIKL